MVGQRSRNTKGFTLIEMLVAFGGLVLAIGVFDLVDLTDWKAYLAAHGVEPAPDSLVRLLDEPARGDYADATRDLASEEGREEARQTLRQAGYLALADLERAAQDSDELIRKEADELLPAARQSWRERKLLIEVACRELARQGAQDAMPALRRLAGSDDYFLAKHAGKALQQLETGDGPERIVLPEEVRALLPEGSEVLADSRSFRADPPREAVRLVAQFAETSALNTTIEKINRAVGNIEVSDFRLVRLGVGEGAFHLVIWGRFDQAAVTGWLVSHGAQQETASDTSWAGTSPPLPHGLRLPLAMARGRVIACFVYPPAPPGQVPPQLSTETLKELVEVYAD